MKLLPRHFAGIPVVAALVMTCASAHAQTSAFTYQGKLSDAGIPANGDYEIKFGLADALSGGSVFNTLTKDPVTVSDGVFTVELDYSASAFIGFNRWIEISVRPSGSMDPFEILSPRQSVTSTPYASHAGSVNASSLIGQVTDANLATTLSFARSFTNPGNTFSGNGASLTQLDATSVATGTLADTVLSSNVALRNGGNTFNGSQVINNAQFQVGNTNGRFNFWGFPLSGGSSLLAGLTGSGTNWPAMRFSRDAGGDFVDIGQNSDGNFQVDGNDIPRLVVQAGGSGNVGIGTTSPGAKLDVNGSMLMNGFTSDANSRVNGRFDLNNPGFANVTSNFRSLAGHDAVLNCQNSQAEFLGGFINELTPSSTNVVFTLAGNASKPGGGSWASTPDRRLKKDIVAIDESLDRLLELRSVTFRYKDPKKLHCEDRVYTGFIAQEVETVFPEWVGENKDGFKNVSISGFEALAVEAFRDLREEKDEQIATLETAQDELKAENEVLTTRLAALEGKLGELAGELKSKETATAAK